MDAKLLTEAGWKALCTKSKVKDNGLLRALANYENSGEEELENRLKLAGTINQLTQALKKAKEISNLPDVIKYLAAVAAASEQARTEITRAISVATKAAVEAKKTADAEAKAYQEGNEEEEEEGEYTVKLWAAFQKLKSAKGLVYQFIVCDAKPCGVMVAKKITSKHKEELAKVTGSKRFLHLGTCQFENGKFVFAMEKPVSGLARKLQESIKHFTGKKLPVQVGVESADADEEGAGAGGEQHVASTDTPHPLLEKAPQAWQNARKTVEANIQKLRSVVRQRFAGEAAPLKDEVEQHVKKLDDILEKLDHTLGETLARAHAAKDPATRHAELAHAKSTLVHHLTYLKLQERWLNHIDNNPFGIQTNVKKTLTDSLKQMSQAVSVNA